MNSSKAPLATRLAPALLALSCPLVAQGLCLRHTAAPTLGSTWSVGYAGASGQNVVFLPSLTAGPIPLSILNPGDTRSLSIGTELSALWTAAPIGTGGTGTFGIPLPANASLAGTDLRAQTVTLPGSPFLVNQLSNVVVARLGVKERSQLLASSLVVARALAVTADAGTGCTTGSLLTLGGGQGSLTSATGLDSSELFNPNDLSVVAGPKMAAARALPVAVALGNGRTLVAGGVDAMGVALNTCEIYDAAANRFTNTGSMGSARAGHFGARLPDGRILVAGGTTTLADPVQALANVQNSVEIYNPTTGTWSAGRSMPRRLLLASLDALPNGRLLLSGGFEVRRLFGIPLPIGTVASCSTYSATTNSWSGAPAMAKGRAGHGLNSVALANGDVLITGGGESGADLTQAQPMIEAEIYRAATNRWQSIPNMASKRLGHSATLLTTGDVLIAGGAIGTVSMPQAIDGVQLYQTSSNSWRNLPNLAQARAGHTAYQTASGTVVLFGGQSSTAATIKTVEQISF